MKSSAYEVRNCLCLSARRAARQLTQYYDRAMRPSGLRVTQFQLLAAIGEAQPVTQQAIAELMAMDRTTLTRNIALLVRDGLVSIDQGPRDRREHHHRLTPAGRKAVTRALPLWRSAQRDAAEHLQRRRAHGPGTGLESFNDLP